MATRESSQSDCPEPPLVRDIVSNSTVGNDVENSASIPDNVTLPNLMDDASKAAYSYSASDITKLLNVLFESETRTTRPSIDEVILRVKMLEDTIRTLNLSESDARRLADDLLIEANELREENRSWSDEGQKLREENRSVADADKKLRRRIEELEHFLRVKTYIIGCYSQAANSFWEQGLTERFELMMYKEKFKEFQDLQKGSFRNHLGNFFVKTLKSMESLGVTSNMFSYIREFVEKLGDVGTVVDASVAADLEISDEDVVVDEPDRDVEGMSVTDCGKFPIEQPEAESQGIPPLNVTGGPQLSAVATLDFIAADFARRSTRTSSKTMANLKDSLPDLKKSLVAGKGKLKRRGRKGAKSLKKKPNLAASAVTGSSKLPEKEIELDISPEYVEEDSTGGVGKSEGCSNDASKRNLRRSKNKKDDDPDWIQSAVKRIKASVKRRREEDVDDEGSKTKRDFKKAGIKGRANAKSSKSSSQIHAVAEQSSRSDQGKKYDWRLIVCKTNHRWPCRECLDVSKHFSSKEHLLRHHCDKHALHFQNSEGLCRRKDCWTRKASETEIEDQEFVIFHYSGNEEHDALKEWNRSNAEVASMLTESISKTMIDLKGKKTKPRKNQASKKVGSEDVEEESDGKDQLGGEEDDED